MPETNSLKPTIENLLKTIPCLVTKNGELKINKIKEEIENSNPKILEVLLKNKSVKKEFFTPVLDSFVFKTREFKEFLDFSFACNSYSKYLGKKIGLYIDEEELTDKTEVVLNFPFKDCVLEGGQTKEDGLDTFYKFNEKTGKYEGASCKRKEIFYNQILARDEIDNLFSPKAFTNAKFYDKTGQKPCTKLNRDAEINKKRGLDENTITDNLIIKGNNLLALHSLKEEFAGKVKLVYIDPPYNTGSDSFSYNDNFNHSSWLTFMKNRLEIAKELLKDDGAIYVQADYHEIHYLKIIMDEIFGIENFQREIIWRIGWLSGYKTIENNWIRNHDTILFYSKNNKQLDFHKFYIPKSEFKKIAQSEAEQYPIEDVWNGNEYDDLNSIAIVSFSGETVSKLLNKEDEVKGQKSEKLLQRIIKAHTKEGEIVLDFFAGTGTTAAVSHKMNRQYIILEQLEKHIDISKRRINKIINGDTTGISKSVSWQGGGSFVYFELAQKNQKAIELINECSTYEELVNLFEELSKKYFLHYNVKINEFLQEIKLPRFKELPLEKQKEMFCRMLDLNQLYVNYSDRTDKSNDLTKDDIDFTQDFYSSLKEEK